MLFMGYVTLLLVRLKLRDDIWLTKESKYTLLNALIGFSIYCVVSFKPFPLADFIKVKIGESVINLFVSLTLQWISIIYPALLARKVSKSKKNIDTSEKAMYVVLANKDLFEKFKEEAAMTFCLENILFLEDVFNVYLKHGHKFPLKAVMSVHQSRQSKLDLEDSSKEVLIMKSIYSEEDLNNLYLKYIKPGSIYELNLSSQVLQNFQADLNSKDLSILDPVIKEVLRMLFQNTFPRFYKTNQQEILKRLNFAKISGEKIKKTNSTLSIVTGFFNG
ncbi:hypothetical protein O9G_002208 [Rozella allomycis CSF55]|uniref:RGS domain-containing protein n=1 Tax=Rozella allomycis (strain CSF55) TaxID=988480 RepID=A0A075AQ79_ROZAC|nr:hypothetical protein O9G_002208 [Rozella allomycis CSF55]|eukprot:EPZ32368.1 hypothetical protein O9G_002208 [Rozella allomycis CSF55]